MDKARFFAGRAARGARNTQRIATGIVGLGVALLASPLFAQSKPDAAAVDGIPTPYCTAGTAASKDGESAIGLYDVGNGFGTLDWVDAGAAKSCLKATGSGLHFDVGDVSLVLTNSVGNTLLTFNPSAPRDTHVKVSEPVLCESYSPVGGSPLSLVSTNTNNELQTVYGIESLSYALASASVKANLSSAAYGPLLRCHAVSTANAPLPPTNVLFNADFETAADLTVEFLDAQGVRLATGAGSNDQRINQQAASQTGIAYQVRVTNSGEVAATNVRVREFLPKSTGVIVPVVQPVSCLVPAQCPAATLSVDIPSLASGASQTFSVTRRAQGSNAKVMVAAFVDPNAVAEASFADNARTLSMILVDNFPPVAVGTLPPASVDEGQVVNIATAQAFSDTDSPSLSYSATGLPAGISIIPATGLITGATGFNTHGVFQITVSASDGTLSANQSFTLTVNNINGAPTIAAALPASSSSEGTFLDISTMAGFADPDGDSLTYTATGLPANIGISPTVGQIVGQLGTMSSGQYQITVTATDTGGLSAMQSFTLTVNNVNAPPTAGTPIPAQSNAEGDLVNLNLTTHFSDTDVGDTLTYSHTGALPAGLALSPTGVISGTIGQQAAGAYAITVSVSDGVASVSAAAFNWTVTSVNVAPLPQGMLADASAVMGDMNGFTISAATIAAAFQDPDGDALTYSATGLPSGIFIQAGTGLIFGSPSAGTEGDHLVTIKATDAGSLFATQIFTLTVTPAP